ncbi:CAP domain-containing protein [Methanohalophilus mahii]|uniref:SCP-like extracellular n=1 Tax=Methanohalophilus mahii (strain ATCC 35705 / DSM 5219 / SLP) TaxID=547558 RepID=D5E8R8_METMS|nr:CAP domain-containing protein [Methanohalophilus mahii]ADE35577.1 SCP-like extracellular [Methanohalophilus mahii DSM 5219]
MEKLKFLLILFLAIAFLIFPAGAENLYSAEEKQMLDLINEERAEQGVSPLQFNSLLNEVSSEHSRDMIENNYFAHDSYDGTSYWQRLQDFNYQSSTTAENIAMNVPFDLQKAHANLMASPGHRTNILNPDYNEIGIGIWVGDYTCNGVTYSNAAMFTQDFGWNTSADEKDLLSIESYSPQDNFSSDPESTQEFAVTTNRPCNIRWLMDGGEVREINNEMTSSYTTSKPSTGTYEVKVIVDDGVSTDIREWSWTVVEDDIDSSYHAYDFNQNCLMDTSEVSKAIDDYYAGKLDVAEISQIIDYWYLGSDGYC